jgi:hypothetical protein
MTRLLRALRVPASESQVGFVLAVSAMFMGVMSLVIVWQAQVIAHQREVIHWLEALKFNT